MIVYKFGNLNFSVHPRKESCFVYIKVNSNIYHHWRRDSIFWLQHLQVILEGFQIEEVFITTSFSDFLNYFIHWSLTYLKESKKFSHSSSNLNTETEETYDNYKRYDWYSSIL